MHPPNRLRPWLWLLGALATVALVAGLAVLLLSSTSFSVDAENGSATTETALGDVSCRKTLSAAFPFVRLECRAQERP